MVALLIGEALLAWSAAGDSVMAILLAGGASFFAMDALLLWQKLPYAAWQMRLFFLGWNAVALFSIPWMWSSATLAAR